ncbi:MULTISPECIES: DMT family transporter [Chelatococcus]|uniref:Drug/metabolite transporter (DMT)-like permease n=1 Tax=Chelatococcus caeni TaxID=1348468 RepID=A0A840C9U5_9HYPH|nr:MULTISPECIES: DMT family transporter [Chelatococcus]ALA17469.1 multidrug DMT transporter permease [Chelatococcus sp. CO-6]MBB4019067.1 drug/metabolite transporter (DMT)-like permease [Chelatococcus caeni]
MSATPAREDDAAASKASPPGNALLGISLMMLGIFMFSVNDVLGKWLVATFTVAQVLLIRSFAALLVLAPFVWREGLGNILTLPKPGLQLARVVFATLEVVFFYWAVIGLPLADVVTYYLAGPIYVTALSALFLREKVGWRRWTAVLVGFAGVLIALRPSAATLDVYALVALLGSIFFALLMITTRHLRGTSDTSLVFWQTLGALVFGIALAPFGWVPPEAGDFALLSLLGVVALAAHISVTRALKHASASVLAPYQYMLIVWAVILGYLVFGDIPDAAMLAGAAIIIAAGLFIFLREQTLLRRR